MKNKQIVIIPSEVIKELSDTVVKIVNEIDWNEAIKAYNKRQQGEFTRVDLESWLYQLAFNNSDNDFGKYCEVIISRLDGFQQYVDDMRGYRNAES